MLETAAELRNHYAAVRRRLMQPALRVPATVIEQPKPAPVRRASTPPIDFTKFSTFNVGRPITGSLGVEPWSMDGATIPTIHNIAKAVCRLYRAPIVEIKSHRRLKAMVRPRFVAMYVCKILTGCSYNDIGRYFGNRDHTSALYAVQSIEGEIGENHKLREEVAEICSQFAGCSHIVLAMRAAMGRLG